jgi:multiple sugar transport system ATP-binding protein
MSKIELRNISKTFGDIVAVDDLDVTFKDESYTMILGPSGCGKSTTLRLIAGLEMPTTGDVLIDDEPVTNEPSRERDLSMVFQSLALWDHKTVRENMGFGLKMDGVEKAERNRRIEDIAELLEIDDKLDQNPNALSGGQQQRVALGRSLVRQPDAILLDEPLSSLDEQLRLKMRTELRRIQQEADTTFIHVTHSQEDAMTVADDILLLEGGTVQQFGSPMELYREPANEFVADFIGTPNMNFADGSLDHDRGVLSAFGVGLRLPASASERVAEADVDGRVRVGVRPESLSFVDDPAGDGAFRTEVSIVETFGDFNWYYVERGDDEFIVHSTDADVIDSVEEGDSVAVRIDPEALHLFDPETSERIA